MAVRLEEEFKVSERICAIKINRNTIFSFWCHSRLWNPGPHYWAGEEVWELPPELRRFAEDMIAEHRGRQMEEEPRSWRKHQEDPTIKYAIFARNIFLLC